MNPFDWIPRLRFFHLAVALALLTALLMAGWKVYHDVREGGRAEGRAEVQALWDADRLAMAEQSQRILKQAQAETQALQEEADQQRKVKDAQIARIAADRDAALERLRDRPARPNGSGAGLSPNPTPGAAPSCTGAQLYREDGQFLVGESARAERLLALLVECQARYQAAQELINR